MKICELGNKEFYHENIFAYADFQKALFLLEGADILNLFHASEIEELVRENLPPTHYEPESFRGSSRDFQYHDIIVSLSGRMARITIHYTRTITYNDGTTNTTTDKIHFYTCRVDNEWYIL